MLLSSTGKEGPVPRRASGLYARLKGEAEVARPRNHIVRLGKVITPDLPHIAGWLEALRSGRPIEAFDAHCLSPITLGYAVDVISALAIGARTGLVMGTGQDYVSRHALARHLAVAVGGACRPGARRKRRRARWLSPPPSPAANGRFFGLLRGRYSRPVYHPAGAIGVDGARTVRHIASLNGSDAADVASSPGGRHVPVRPAHAAQGADPR